MTDGAVVEVLRGRRMGQELRSPRIVALESDHVLVAIVREVDREL